MTSFESAFFAPLTLKFRCVDGYGWPFENSPVEVSDEFGWMTCRMLLSSNGPPLRTTMTCPPSALVKPDAKAMPGTTPTKSTTIPATTMASARRARDGRRGIEDAAVTGDSWRGRVLTSSGLYGRVRPPDSSAPFRIREVIAQVGRRIRRVVKGTPAGSAAGLHPLRDPPVDGELLLQPGEDRDAVLDEEPAADDGVPRRDRAAAQPRLDRIRQRAGEGDTRERPHRQVPAGTHREPADLAGPPEAGRAADGGQLQRVPRRH